LQRLRLSPIIALSFLAFYPPLAPSLTITGTAIRLYTDWKSGSDDDILPLLKTPLSAAAFAVTCFISYRLGMVITTSQDMLAQAFIINHCAQKGFYKATLLRTMYLITDSLYLAVLLGGGFPVTIASFSFVVLTKMHQTYESIKRKEYAFASIQVLLGLGRTYQGYNYYQLKEKPISFQKVS